MHEEEIKKLDSTARAQLAIAFLLTKEDERPKGSEHLFGKLEKFDESLRTIITSMVEMMESMKELQMKHEHLNGAISAVVELLSEEFMNDENKILDWCRRFEPPKNLDDIRQRNFKNNINSRQPDMAGSTAKQVQSQKILN